MKKQPKSVSYKKEDSAFSIWVDDTPARTPLGNALVVPAVALAEAVVEECRHHTKIAKATMPMSLLASIAIDVFAKPGPRLLHVSELLGYLETDLVCYRAGNIPILAALQAEQLNPVLSWAAHHYTIILETTDGLMPLPESPENTAKLAHALAHYNEWQLAALHSATKPLGSLLLGLALVEGRISADEAFTLSTLEEAYETQAWGRDEEKEQKLATLREEVRGGGAVSKVSCQWPVISGP